MRKSMVSHFSVALITALIMAFIFSTMDRREKPINDSCPALGGSEKQREQLDQLMPRNNMQTAANYKAHTYDFKAVNGLSESQLSQHHKLYQGYVNKRNEIEASLKTAERDKQSPSYTVYRGLKVGETFALNGVILHELYFENIIGGTGTKMGPATEALIKQNFGSVQQFKEDLIACASCARGWVMTGFCIFDGSVHNFLLDAHNETVPVLTLPLLMVDTYEHAYMIDFGINRADYLKIVWENINWDVVEKRIEMWVMKQCLN